MKTTKKRKKNAHYVIIQSVIIGEDEYVLEKHETEEKYVTWHYANGAYYYGHYIDVMLRQKSTFIPVVSTKWIISKVNLKIILPIGKRSETMKRNNRYSYKIGYRENGSLSFIRYFMTYTYKQALFSLEHYRKYPQRERETVIPIVNPFGEIRPITKQEYEAGIWDEIPF